MNGVNKIIEMTNLQKKKKKREISMTLFCSLKLGAWSNAEGLKGFCFIITTHSFLQKIQV